MIMGRLPRLLELQLYSFISMAPTLCNPYTIPPRNGALHQHLSIDVTPPRR